MVRNPYMIDPKTKLTVLHDDNSTFVDHSDNAADYTRDTFDVTLVAAEDKFYMGFTKPFSGVYAEFTTANTNAKGSCKSVRNACPWKKFLSSTMSPMIC